MKYHGRTSVAEFIEDMIVYRNLVPMDTRLPALEDMADELGLPASVIPRKSELAYARVIAHLLTSAHALEHPAGGIQRLVFVGDTELNDGTAFVNVCAAGGWPGLAFIGSEKAAPPAVDIIRRGGHTLYLANRWSALPEFSHYCEGHGFPFDEHTAVILDLDKTTLGARGRNDSVINEARVEAVRQTVGDLLGDAFDLALFQAAYDQLNQTAYHPFTTDNQDYLAYICLIIGSGLFGWDGLKTDIHTGRLASFEQFITEVDARKDEIQPNLRDIHQSVYALVQERDPTPFKEFRYNEYKCTVERLGCLADDAPVEEMLAEEILITQEVRDIAHRWKAQGALLFALSDKPDEASIPTDDLAEQGYLPIHQMETHAVGEA
jgi:hypothetical protein